MLRTLRWGFGLVLAGLLVAGAGCNRPPSSNPGDGNKPGEKEPNKKPKPPEREPG